MPLVLFPCSPSPPRGSRVCEEDTSRPWGPRTSLAPHCSHSLVQASVKGPLPWPGFWRTSASLLVGGPQGDQHVLNLSVRLPPRPTPTSRLKVADQGCSCWIDNT